MAVGDAHVFPGFLTPVLKQLFFPKPPTTFLTCFCRGERRKYAGEKSRVNRGSNTQPPGHESDALTTGPPFSHASVEMRGENTPERKFASTGDRTHNHQVMSPACTLLSHPGGAGLSIPYIHLQNYSTFSFYHIVFNLLHRKQLTGGA